MNKTYDTIIIGAGIAGLTAGIYAARKKMNFLILAEEFGGQMNISGEVLNYPGIIETTGAEFRSIMQKQAEFNEFKVNEGEKVVKIEKKKEIFIVKTNKGDYSARTVIVASGSRPRKLDIPGENEYRNKGVHYCAICDGPLYPGKNVAIIGGGNSALEAVDFMNGIANKIYLLNIGNKFKAHQYLIDRLNSLEKVEIINNAMTKEIIGDKMVGGIKYSQDGKEKNLEVDGLFIEIGRIPNIDFVKDFVELDKHGHIQIDENMGTSVPGLFAVGDVSSVHEYQYVISAGQGCIALIKAARYLVESAK